MQTVTKPQQMWPQPTLVQEDIIYPESDGLPLADNSKQFRVITTIQGNLDILYEDDPQVLVVGDMFWYPVQGNSKLRRAPDVMVAFGVPKGDRAAYLQWQENNIAPQVVFEIRSPSNTNKAMAEKQIFYDRYGVHEYYLYDPDRGTLEGWLRRGPKLVEISQMRAWVSPQLDIRFDLIDDDLKLYHPDGNPFLTFLELNEQRRAETLARFAAEIQIDQVEQRAAEAEQRATEAEQSLQAEAQARAKAEARLRAAETKLRELGLL